MARRRDAPIRVMLVEDNAAVRSAVASLLSAKGEIEVCGEAGTVAEAGRVAAGTRPDVAIVDLRLPDGSGVEAARDVRSQRPGARVLLLTSASEEEALLAAVLAGASGYVVKQLSGSALVPAVEAVGRGETLIDRAAGARAVARFGDAIGSSQDARLLELVAEGRADAEIGQELGVDAAVVGRQVVSLATRLRGGATQRGINGGRWGPAPLRGSRDESPKVPPE